MMTHRTGQLAQQHVLWAGTAEAVVDFLRLVVGTTVGEQKVLAEEEACDSFFGKFQRVLVSQGTCIFLRKFTYFAAKLRVDFVASRAAHFHLAEVLSVALHLDVFSRSGKDGQLRVVGVEDVERGLSVERQHVVEAPLLNVQRVDAVEPDVAAVDKKLTLLKVSEPSPYAYLARVVATAEQGEQKSYAV